jgi:Na+/proline symporter
VTNASTYIIAFRVLSTAIGLFATIRGIRSDSVVVALNTVGVIGLAPLVIGGAILLMDGDLEENLKPAVVTASVVAVISCFLFFVIGRPLDEEERGANLLTVLGVVAVAAFTLAATVGWQLVTKKQQKTCPDCANAVLAAASKCQHCGYRFDSAGTTAP